MQAGGKWCWDTNLTMLKCDRQAIRFLHLRAREDQVLVCGTTTALAEILLSTSLWGHRGRCPAHRFRSQPRSGCCDTCWQGVKNLNGDLGRSAQANDQSVFSAAVQMRHGSLDRGRGSRRSCILPCRRRDPDPRPGIYWLRSWSISSLGRPSSQGSGRIRITLLEARDIGDCLFGPAGGLMPQNNRRFGAAPGFRRAVLDDGYIGMAATCPSNLEQNPAAPRGRLRHFLEGGEGVELFENNGFHKLPFIIEAFPFLCSGRGVCTSASLQ